MTVYDEVMYNGKICVVEETWEAGDAAHTPFCQIRPTGPDEAYSGEYSGTFYVEQSATRPLPTIHH